MGVAARRPWNWSSATNFGTDGNENGAGRVERGAGTRGGGACRGERNRAREQVKPVWDLTPLVIRKLTLTVQLPL